MGQLISKDVYEFDNSSTLERDPECKEIRLIDEYGNSDELRVWEEGKDNTEYDEWDSYFDETEEAKREREYVAHKGVKCLHCESQNITSGSVDWDEPFTVKVSCDDCGKSWRDVFTLVGVVEE